MTEAPSLRPGNLQRRRIDALDERCATMPVRISRARLVALMSMLMLVFACGASAQKLDSRLQEILRANRYDLSTPTGRQFLVGEAVKSQFLFLGELEGSREMPALIRDLWPSLVKSGYHHVAIELGPWMTSLLDSGDLERYRETAIPDLQPWAEEEIALRELYEKGFQKTSPVLWGCDQEIEPDILVRNLAVLDPGNAILIRWREQTAKGFNPKDASAMLKEIDTLPEHGKGDWDIQLRLLKDTLRIWSAKNDPETKLRGQMMRENLMKRHFVENYRRAEAAGEDHPRVFVRFGRNHGHRGYDRRGVSTFGNFMAEFARLEGGSMFNVAAFASGGKLALDPGGPPTDWDERPDDPTFALLSHLSDYRVTLFDLRPLRQALHSKEWPDWNSGEEGLRYWADSYDAIISYRTVTPLEFR